MGYGCSYNWLNTCIIEHAILPCIKYDSNCTLLFLDFVAFWIFAFFKLDWKRKLTWHGITLVRSISIKTQFIFGAFISFLNALVYVDTISCLIFSNQLISSKTDITDAFWLTTEIFYCLHYHLIIYQLTLESGNMIFQGNRGQNILIEIFSLISQWIGHLLLSFSF